METATAVDVLNTCSWARTDVVTLPKELAVAGNVVRDATGRDVPSQRLSTGELAFLALDIIDLALNDPRDYDNRPSGLFGSLEIDLQGGANGRLSAKNWRNLAVEVRLQAELDLDLDVTITVGDGAEIASFTTILHYDQELASLTWNSKARVKLSVLGNFTIFLEQATFEIAGFAELSGNFLLQKHHNNQPIPTASYN